MKGEVGRGEWGQGSILGASHSCQTVVLLISGEVGDAAEGMWAQKVIKV